MRNWIDSFGHTAGVMGLRLIKATEPPPVTTDLVALDALECSGSRCLTPETARVSGEVTA